MLASWLFVCWFVHDLLHAHTPALSLLLLCVSNPGPCRNAHPPQKSARPTVRPNKDVAQSLGGGELVWNLTACEKQDTAVIASLLT